jgi:hypothetical protein
MDSWTMKKSSELKGKSNRFQIRFEMLTNEEKMKLTEVPAKKEDLERIREVILQNRSNPLDIQCELDTLIHNLLHKPKKLPKPKSK